MYDIAVVLVRQGASLIFFSSWRVTNTTSGVGIGRRAAINTCVNGSRVHRDILEQCLYCVHIVIESHETLDSHLLSGIIQYPNGCIPRLS